VAFGRDLNIVARPIWALDFRWTTPGGALPLDPWFEAQMVS